MLLMHTSYLQFNFNNYYLLRFSHKTSSFFLHRCYYSVNSLSNAFRRTYVKDIVYIEKNSFVQLIWKKIAFRVLLIEGTILTDWTRLIDNCSMDFASDRSVFSLKLSNQRLVVRRRPYGAPLTASRSHTLV